MMLDAFGLWVVYAYVASFVPLGLAWFVTRLLRRRRASVRHHVWLMAIGMILLAPPARVVVPRVNIPILRRASDRSNLFAGTKSPAAPVSRDHDISLPRSTGFEFRSLSGAALFGLFWLAGAAPLLCVNVVRRIRLARLSAKALVLEAYPDVYTHHAVVIPLLVGLTRPRIMLPAAASRWPSDELEAVLAHERAHRRRFDPVAVLMADVATTAYWLNPLVWMARIALERERERACDDEVLHLGVKPSVYAGALMRVARGLSSAPLLATPSMAGGQLGERIRTILMNPTPSSGCLPLSWRHTVALLFVCTVAFSCVHAVTRLPQAREGEVLFTVNGETFDRSDLQRYETEARRQPVPAVRSDAGGDDLPRTLLDAVDDMLVVQRGKQLGYMLSEEQFRRLIQNIRERNRLEEGGQFQAALRQEHLTLAELRQQLERQTIVSRMRVAEYSTQGPVAESEARRYYDTHADEFSTISFERARDRIEEQIAMATLNHRWNDYLDTLRSMAVIDWRRADLKRAYEDGLAHRAIQRQSCNSV